MHRVLMIAPTPFFADRGCHVRILGEVRALQDAGCEVRLCTYHNGRDVEGVQTARIPTVPWYDRLEAGPSHQKYYLDVLLAARALGEGLRFRPDVVHAHLHEGAALARAVAPLLGVPWVFDYQGSLADELAAHDYLRRDGWAGRLAGRVERSLDRAAERVLVSHVGAERRLEARLGPGRVVLVPDGVDTGRFRPLDASARREVRRRHGLPEEGVLALYVGVLAPYQGTDLLLDHAAEALERAPELSLLLVGYPEATYRERARELGLGARVRFTGRVPFEATAELTAAADLALAPKVSESEGNLKLLAYLACGLPVVAFDTEVNRSILGDVGVYAPAGDGAAFAREVAALAADPERRRSLGRSGRRLAEEEYAWDRSAERILEAYRAVGAKARAAAA